MMYLWWILNLLFDTVVHCVTFYWYKITYLYFILIPDAFVTKDDPEVKYILKNAAIGAG